MANIIITHFSCFDHVLNHDWKINICKWNYIDSVFYLDAVSQLCINTVTVGSKWILCYLYHEAKAENYLLIWKFSITWNVNLKWQETYNRIMGEVGKVTCSISSWFVSKLHFYLYHNVSEFSSTFSLLFYMFHVKFVFQHSYLVRSNLTLLSQRILRIMHYYNDNNPEFKI